MPLVSVIMPAYNCEQTLEAAAASVFSQTVSGWELIIVDDASRDGTAALANNLCARDPRVRLVTNERNLGVAANEAKSSNEYIRITGTLEPFWACPSGAVVLVGGFPEIESFSGTKFPEEAPSAFLLR